MARDKIYGFLILLFSILVVLYYTYWALVYPFMFYSVNPTGAYPTAHPWWQFFFWIPVLVEPYFAVAIPMWLAIMLVLFIVAWIGWTMLTTPPPIPLEEIEEEEEAKEE
ncbi:MAG: hypothetical protein Q6364_09850 [Candidatus Hermodarchaeota archaeon]|jgi:lysylphosphatidylglycerol synthetase-like protein (DUF2156 family)|nr:hypothetical protein [Candidatus Hermodarchaeota archaeon]